MLPLKSYRPRLVFLPDKGTALFLSLTDNKKPKNLLFVKDSGTPCMEITITFSKPQSGMLGCRTTSPFMASGTPLPSLREVQDIAFLPQMILGKSRINPVGDRYRAMPKILTDPGHTQALVSLQSSPHFSIMWKLQIRTSSVRGR